MPDTSIELTATENTTVTPRFDFSSGTVKVYIDDVYEVDLTSGVAGSIALLNGEVIKYTASDWDSITRLDISGDKVSGDISGWTLPNNLILLYIYSTSVSGDISGWILPNSITGLYLYSTSVSGDISGWTLPNNLSLFRIYSTSVSGDISGWILPNNLILIYIFSTSLDYDSSVGVFVGITDNLEKIDFDNCNLTQVQVDRVLANCVASGIDNSVNTKALDIGDNNDAPSGIGLMNKKILIARGWAVKTTATSFYELPLGFEFSRTGHSFASRQEI